MLTVFIFFSLDWRVAVVRLANEIVEVVAYMLSGKYS